MEWWLVADMFRNTYLAVAQGKKFQACEMISLSSSIDSKTLEKLIKEKLTNYITFTIEINGLSVEITYVTVHRFLLHQ